MRALVELDAVAHAHRVQLCVEQPDFPVVEVDLPGSSETAESLYLHCVRAIRHGLRFGPHGLPLIGSGDWNDGMNRVGIQGKGESVWLGFFLYAAATGIPSIVLAIIVVRYTPTERQ